MNKENNNLNNGTVFEDEEMMSMEDLLGPEMNLSHGQILDVTIIAENEDGFLVDLGMKSESLIPKAEFGDGVIPSELKTGAKVKVYVKNNRGRIELSYREVVEKELWDKIESIFKNKETVKGTIAKAVKGGVIVNIGLNAFLHISQIDTAFVKDSSKYIGKTYDFAITEFDRNEKKIVLSRRKLLEDEKLAKKASALESLADGQILDGTVVRITNFGAFVNIGGIDGLLHIGELAWYKVKKVEDILSVGQNIRVQIIKIDKENEKISLSMKQLATKPWDCANEKYPEGLIVKGKVTSVMPYGAFVELEPGIEGLLHSSEYAWNDSEFLFKKEVKAGKELDVKVISFDKESQKIALSVKKIQQNPWEQASRHYVPGNKVKGIVQNIAPFGAFVKLPEGIEGLIHISDFAWIKKISHPEEMLKKGDEVEVVVLEVNPQNEKISLSLKHLQADPYKKYKLGAIVNGKVTRATEFGVFIEIEEGIEVLVKKNELSSENKNQEFPKEGEELEVKIIRIDTKERKIEGSVKKLEKAMEKELVEKFAINDDRPTLGDILQED